MLCLYTHKQLDDAATSIATVPSKNIVTGSLTEDNSNACSGILSPEAEAPLIGLAGGLAGRMQPCAGMVKAR